MKRRLVFCLFLIFSLGNITAEELALVQSEEAEYDGNKIILTKNVKVHSPLGEIFADAIILYPKIEGDKKHLQAVESFGKTVLIYENKAKKIKHQLTCYGTARIDQEMLRAVFESPKNANNAIDLKDQVCLEDAAGRIYGDRLYIDYTMDGKCVVPAKVRMEGNIRILNQGKEESKGFSQRAVADEIHYDPLTQEASLCAEKRGRVLFFDQMNGMKVSAPALKIIRDEKFSVQDLKIKGVGDVRFSFVDKEQTDYEACFPER